MKPFAIAFAIAAPVLWAQAPGTSVGTGANGFSGPTLGFVQGSSPWQLQPIVGFPGAARLGDPISLPNTVTQAYLAPGHAYALTAEGPADPAALAILRGAGGMAMNPPLRALPGALARPDLVAFSATGQSMALYSQPASRIQVFTGLPNSPRLSEEIANIGNAAKLAVSDDAQALLIADGTGAVYSLAQNTGPVFVYHSSEVGALAFVSQSHDAIVCDPEAGTAAVLEAVNGNTGVKMLLPPSGSGCQPQTAVSTADGRTILLACPAQHLIWTVDRVSGSTETYRVSSSPAGFDRLAVRDAFLMSPPDGGGTYWLVTWRPDGLETTFVGAIRHANQGPGN